MSGNKNSFAFGTNNDDFSYRRIDSSKVVINPFRNNFSINESCYMSVDEIKYRANEIKYRKICPELFKVLSINERRHLNIDMEPREPQAAYARFYEPGKTEPTVIEINDAFIDYLRDAKNSRKGNSELTEEEIQEAMKNWISRKKLVKKPNQIL